MHAIIGFSEPVITIDDGVIERRLFAALHLTRSI